MQKATRSSGSSSRTCGKEKFETAVSNETNIYGSFCKRKSFWKNLCNKVLEGQGLKPPQDVPQEVQELEGSEKRGGKMSFSLPEGNLSWFQSREAKNEDDSEHTQFTPALWSVISVPRSLPAG